jgi:hypothetical protein
MYSIDAPEEIDYNLVAKAVNFYKSLGYRYMEVPWVVSKKAYYATKPPDTDDINCETLGGYLAASGEQGFLELMLRFGSLPQSKAVCATPCFRAEQNPPLTLPWFFKVELIDTETSNFDRVLVDAHTFINRLVPCRFVNTGPDSVDIISNRNGIELGSYGIRRFENYEWVYGTGLALPRTTSVVLA